MCQVADVGARQRRVAVQQRRRVFQVAAGGQHGGAVGGQGQHVRHVAPAAAQRGAAQRIDAQHAVVAAGVDGAIVQQKAVGDAGQRGERFVVTNGHRCAAGVAAGHHQQHGLGVIQPAGAGRSAGGFVPQQQVQRRRRQQHAQLGQARRQRVRQRHVAARQQYDGARRAGQQRGFGGIQLHHAVQAGQVGRHQRQRLGRAVLALAQAGDGGGVTGIASQMKAAAAFYCHDAAALQRGQRQCQRVAGLWRTLRAQVVQLRAAGRAASGFGVKAAACRLLVVGVAGRAQCKAGQRGGAAVVGQGAGHAVARAALRAVDEGVAPVAASRLAQLGQASVARCAVGR